MSFPDGFADGFDDEVAGFLHETFVNRIKEDELDKIDDSLRDFAKDSTSYLAAIKTSLVNLAPMLGEDIPQDAEKAAKVFARGLLQFQASRGLAALGVLTKAASNILDRNIQCADCQGPRKNAKKVAFPEGGKDISFFIERVPDVLGASEAQAKSLVRVAMKKWLRVCGVGFVSANAVKDAHLLITTGDIDGTGNDLARADLGPPSGKQLTLRFDVNESFVREFSQSGDGKVFQAVALHELGHSLGLSHQLGGVVWDVDAVMHGTYRGDKTELHQQDIDEVQEIWGPPE